MAKLLRLRDYVLFATAFAGDVIDETRLGWGIVPSVMRGYYGFVPPKYKRASYLSTVSRMLSVGDIKRVSDKKGRSYLELTSFGRKKFKRRFALFTQDKKWDGYFMIVVFDIAEKKRAVRDGLRAKLKSLGFGMLQRSVWISPYHFEEEMREYLERVGLGESVFVFSGKKLWVGDLVRVARKTWRLKKVNKLYKRVKVQVLRMRTLGEKKRKNALTKALSLYFQALALDPLLPKELLPKDWQKDNALNLLNNVSDELS